VLKLFDTFTSLSVELLFLLNYLYEDIYIIKPLTSRPANSEKYIVCIHFRMVKNIDEIIEKMIRQYDVRNRNITSIMNLNIPLLFIDKVKDINSITGQSQVEHIQNILSYMLDQNRKNTLEHIKRTHLIKCIKICKKYNLPIDESLLT